MAITTLTLPEWGAHSGKDLLCLTPGASAYVARRKNPLAESESNSRLLVRSPSLAISSEGLVGLGAAPFVQVPEPTGAGFPHDKYHTK